MFGNIYCEVLGLVFAEIGFFRVHRDAGLRLKLYGFGRFFARAEKLIQCITLDIDDGNSCVWKKSVVVRLVLDGNVENGGIRIDKGCGEVEYIGCVYGLEPFVVPYTHDDAPVVRDGIVREVYAEFFEHFVVADNRALETDVVVTSDSRHRCFPNIFFYT